MRNFMMKSQKIGLIILCLVLIVPGSVSAIGVNGAKYMDSIKPGGTDTHTMTVSIGASEAPTDLAVEVFGFGQNMDQGYSVINPTDDISPYSARSFITLDKNALHLEPGTVATVKAKISIPGNAAPGGRYALIYIHALPGKGKSFTTAVLVPVLITIPGTTPIETGSIINLSVSDVTIGQPISITTTFKNTGNYHYYHNVNTVTVYNGNGNVIGNFSTQPSVYAIIPGNTVQYSATPEIQNLPVGTYMANSKILLDGGKVLDEKSTTFTVNKNYISPVTESKITLTPGSAGTLATPDRRYSVSFPQGAVLGDAVVTLKPFSKDKLQAAPANAKLGATCFEITGLSGLLSKDATVKVTYSADDLAAAGGDTTKLKLAYFDAAQNAWVILPTQVNAGSTTLTATTNHMGVWTVMVSSSTSSGSSAPGATATKSPVPMIVILASLIIAVIAVGKSVRK